MTSPVRLSRTRWVRDDATAGVCMSAAHNAPYAITGRRNNKTPAQAPAKGTDGNEYQSQQEEVSRK